MEIKTECGIEINCLPDYARCQLTGKDVFDMNTCPAMMFDAFGVLCISDICEHYTEDMKGANH